MNDESKPGRPEPVRVLPYSWEAAVAHLRVADPKLVPVIDAVGARRLELRPASSIFAALTEAIIYQQLHGKAAATIHGRVCALYPRAAGGPTPAHILKTPDERLRGAGLSGAKLAALRDLATRTKAGELPTLAEAQVLEDAVLLERLTAVRGIGPWTVQMLLMFRLGRPDVLPVGDFGVREGFRIAYRKRVQPTPEALARHGRRWAPFRSVASWYLWRAVEAGRTTEHREGIVAKG